MLKWVDKIIISLILIAGATECVKKNGPVKERDSIPVCDKKREAREDGEMYNIEITESTEEEMYNELAEILRERIGLFIGSEICTRTTIELPERGVIHSKTRMECTSQTQRGGYIFVRINEVIISPTRGNCWNGRFRIPKLVLKKNDFINMRFPGIGSREEYMEYYNRTSIIYILNDRNSTFHNLLRFYNLLTDCCIDCKMTYEEVERQEQTQVVFIYPSEEFENFLEFLERLRNNRFIDFEIIEEDGEKSTIEWNSRADSENLLRVFRNFDSSNPIVYQLQNFIAVDTLPLAKIFLDYLGGVNLECISEQEASMAFGNVGSRFREMFRDDFNPPQNVRNFENFRDVVRKTLDLMVKLNLCEQSSSIQNFFHHIAPNEYNEWISREGFDQRNTILLAYQNRRFQYAFSILEEMWREGKDPCAWTLMEMIKKLYIEGNEERAREIFSQSRTSNSKLREISWLIGIQPDIPKEPPETPIGYITVAQRELEENQNQLIMNILRTFQLSSDNADVDPLSHLIVLWKGYTIFNRIGFLYDAMEFLRFLREAKGDIPQIRRTNVESLLNNLEGKHPLPFRLSVENGVVTTESEVRIENTASAVFDNNLRSYELNEGWNIIEILMDGEHAMYVIIKKESQQ